MLVKSTLLSPAFCVCVCACACVERGGTYSSSKPAREQAKESEGEVIH